MNNKQLQDILKKYPDDYVIKARYEDDYYLTIHKSKEDANFDIDNKRVVKIIYL